MEMADQVMRALRKNLVDFLEPEDIAEWNRRK
jgi:hypothetical protein